MAAKRPFYVIAHRCNNAGDVEKVLRKGANAVECDVCYGKEADDWRVNHDVYSEKHSILLSSWLEDAYSLTKSYDICFLYLDIKSWENLSNLIRYVHKYTDSLVEKYGKPIYLIYSICYISRAMDQFVANAVNLKPWEGFTVDMFNDPEEVNECFKEIIKREKEQGREFNRFFYGNGIEAGIIDTVWMRKNLREACGLRDKDKIFKKTYTWTIEKTSTAKNYLEIGVDGIMTNAGGGDEPRDKIENIFEAIKEYNEDNPLKQVRLATSTDNPFEVFG